MREEWKEKTLGEIGKIQTGSTPKTSEKDNFGRYIPFIKPADFLTDGSLDYENQGLSKKGLAKSRLVEKDSVLMVCIGTIGKVGFTEKDVTTNQQINSLTPFEGYSTKFVYYRMLTAGFQRNVIGNAGQTTLPIINKKKWSNLKLYLPSLPEQKRIVAILDEAFAGIATAVANTEKNLANARELFDSYLNNTFAQKGEGWVEKPLAELCNIKHGFAFKSEFFSNHGDYIMLTPGNFQESGGYRDRGEKQKYYCGEIPRDYVLEKGDMLVAMTEQAAGLLGSPILIPESDKFLHNQRLGLGSGLITRRAR